MALVESSFAGFVAGWVEEDESLAETPDSNRHGLVSDLCVLAPFRGRRIAAKLLDAMQERFECEGISRIRIGALAANGSARSSYERAGFAPYEVIYEKIVGGTGRARL